MDKFKNIKIHARTYKFLILGVVTYLLQYVFNPSLLAAYIKCLFNPIRIVYDHTLGFCPLPMIYICLVICGALIINKIGDTRQYQKSKNNLWTALQFLFNVFGLLYFLFYFLWGFNYHRPSLEKIAGLDTKEIKSGDILNELNAITTKANQLSIQYHKTKEDLNWQELENEVRENQIIILADFNIFNGARVRVRKLYPAGALLSFSTAGIYIPFVMEGHIDAGLHKLSQPFTLAHEMAHGYGITDEGDCNFMAYVTCLKSTNVYVQYSATLSYWKYLYFDYQQLDSSEAKNAYQNLNILCKQDLKDIRNKSNSYPDILPNLRNLIYDQYLKSNGVGLGLKSYNKIIPMVISYKKSKSKQEESQK